MPETSSYQVYRYRWVVLAVFMLINLAIEILWIGYAAITGPAAEFYGVTDLQIGLLAMIFMIIYIPLSIPVSWVLDTYGFKFAVGIGAILMSIFGVLRGLAGTSYNLVLISTIGIAVAQPFLMNAWTKVAAQWFSIDERATAVGLASVSNLIGTAIGLVLTPILILSSSIPTVQLIYGGIAAFCAVLFLAFAREAPPTPPCPPGMEARALMLDGLKHALSIRPFWILLFVFFIGNGLFNGISTWIENIVRPRGFTPQQAGVLGGLLLVGGIVGAIILPPLSDKSGKRRIFMLIGVACSIPGLSGITFANTYWLLLLSTFEIGFFLVAVSPIGYQYVAELTYPTPEGTSNGLIVLAGQLSVVFVYAMEALQGSDGSFTTSLLIGVVLIFFNVYLISRLKDTNQVSMQGKIQGVGSGQSAVGR